MVISSSTGSGHPPTNGAVTYAALTDVNQPGDLSCAHFAVLGLGASTFVRFMRVPTRIDEALARRGGTRLLPRGVADAAGDQPGAVAAWFHSLWPVLMECAEGLNTSVERGGVGPSVSGPTTTTGSS